jgi:hypothetical protein
MTSKRPAPSDDTVNARANSTKVARAGENTTSAQTPWLSAVKNCIAAISAAAAAALSRAFGSIAMRSASVTTSGKEVVVGTSTAIGGGSG